MPTGDCFLAPAFGGLGSVLSAGSSSCATLLTWSPASPYCGGDVRYNVYRSLSSGFTPGPANRIARCVIGTTYSDSAALTSGTAYHYAVRAEDATEGHGGPCRGGNEETNSTKRSATPDGPLAVGTWSDDGGDTGTAKFSAASPWTIAATGGNTGPKVYTAASAAGLCVDLTSPVITLADPGEGPQIVFATRHTLAYDPFGPFGAEGSVGQVEIATGPGFGNWTRLPLTPNYPALVEFPLNNCPTTANIDRYFSGTASSYSTYVASLVNWAGGEVMIRFHLSGDFLYDTGNWWIDDVVVTKAVVPGPCAIAPVGPPPIPDGGAVPGAPLLASKIGDDVLVTWDAATCPAAAVNIYRGSIGDYSTFTAGSCGLAPSGSATLPLPGNVWFLVAATDGGATDGSWGRDLGGLERIYSGAAAACPAISQHVTNNGCP